MSTDGIIGLVPTVLATGLVVGMTKSMFPGDKLPPRRRRKKSPPKRQTVRESLRTYKKPKASRKKKQKTDQDFWFGGGIKF